MCQGLGYEDPATSQVHGYRWKKFGMPFKVFQDAHFVLQPLLVMSQVSPHHTSNSVFVLLPADPSPLTCLPD